MTMYFVRYSLLDTTLNNVHTHVQASSGSLRCPGAHSGYTACILLSLLHPPSAAR